MSLKIASISATFIQKINAAMLVVGIIAGLLTFIIIWLLVAPIVIALDSGKGTLSISFSGFINAYVFLENNMPMLRIKVPFYHFTKPLISGKTKTKTKTKKIEDPGKKKKGAKKSFKSIIKIIYGLVKSFQLKRFNFNIDTDDYILNAQLVPVFSWLNLRRNVHFSTNYKGDFNCDFLITNRLYRMIRPVIRYW